MNKTHTKNIKKWIKGIQKDEDLTPTSYERCALAVGSQELLGKCIHGMNVQEVRIELMKKTGIPIDNLTHIENMLMGFKSEKIMSQQLWEHRIGKFSRLLKNGDLQIGYLSQDDMKKNVVAYLSEFIGSDKPIERETLSEITSGFADAIAAYQGISIDSGSISSSRMTSEAEPFTNGNEPTATEISARLGSMHTEGMRTMAYWPITPTFTDRTSWAYAVATS